MTADGTDNARDVATQQEGAEIHPTYPGRDPGARGRLEVAVAIPDAPGTAITRHETRMAACGCGRTGRAPY